MISERYSAFGFFMKVLLLWHLHLKLVCGLNCLYECVERKYKKKTKKHHCKKQKRLKNCYCVRKKCLLCGIKVKADCTHHLGSKLAGALMSHNSFLFFLRFCARVLLQGSWQKETKSGGHWYLVVLSVD